MSDKLQKYLAAGTAAAKPEQIGVEVAGDKWSVRRLTTWTSAVAMMWHLMMMVQQRRHSTISTL
ncbi:hypothetical protein [Paenibacillus polymyxa]|uniref:hypothetical protein n=1 Tax=Paenibacillus polymyxa TaxID=1406 RepID=UPI002379F774|nr:hypothetical protein [Paenibacillus polymyxa]